MSAPRLIDLHCDWLLQYACETTVFDPAIYAGVQQRLSQAVGYLQGTSAAVLSCYRRVEDWKSQADPWYALIELIARYEAEFPGRLLIGPDDFRRWQEEPEGLCWGILGIEGFDFLIRESDDLGRLPQLFDRGVRVFQPVYSADNRLAGSSEIGDSRGLTELGLAFLETLADLPGGPRPALDLAHMNPTSISETLDWFESMPSRADRLIPVFSHGSIAHEDFQSPRALRLESLARLRALGGVVGFSVGPPFYSSSRMLKSEINAAASFPFQGRMGVEGLAFGTDFLGVDRTLSGLGNVEELLAWIGETFPPEIVEAITQNNAMSLVRRLTGSLVIGGA